MNLCHILKFFAAGAVGASSCFAGLTNLNDQTLYRARVLFEGVNIGVYLRADPDGNVLTDPTISGSVGKFTTEVKNGSSSYNESFQTWCFELIEYTGGNSSYTYAENDSLLDPVDYASGTPDSTLSMKQLQLIQLAFEKNRKEAFSTLQYSAAMQLVIWEIVYDDTDLSLDANSGNFYVRGTQNAFVESGTGSRDIAEDWLTALGNETLIPDDQYSPRGLFGFLGVKDGDPKRCQNQISYVPEPSVLGLQGLFIAIILLRRRTRR